MSKQVFFILFYFIYFCCSFSQSSCHSLLSSETFLSLDETQYMREKMSQGSHPGPRSETTSVDFSSNAVFFFLCLSVCARLSVWAYLPWECLHWKHVAKRQEVVKLKPSVLGRWAEVPLPAAMNGSFRGKCKVAGRAAPYPPREERWKCVRERERRVGEGLREVVCVCMCWGGRCCKAKAYTMAP